jgi:hypothetical protein
VAESEGAGEPPPDESSPQQTPQDAEGKLVVDFVFEERPVPRNGPEAMRVHPTDERAVDLYVAEALSFPHVLDHRLPANGSRRPAKLEGQVPSLAQSRVALHNAKLLPRRDEALEGAGSPVPGEDIR